MKLEWSWQQSLAFEKWDFSRIFYRSSEGYKSVAQDTDTTYTFQYSQEQIFIILYSTLK